MHDPLVPKPHSSTSSLQGFLSSPAAAVISLLGNIISICLALFTALSGAVWMMVPFTAFFICFVVLRLIEQRKHDAEIVSIVPTAHLPTIHHGEHPAITLLPPLSTPAPAPNIVIVRDSMLSKHVTNDGFAFRENAGRPTHVAVTAKLENVPKPPNKVASAEKVCARVSYEYLPRMPVANDAIPNTPVNHACWLNHEGAYIDFPLNTPRHVIIGLFQTNPEIPLAVRVGAPMQIFGISPETRRPQGCVSLSGGDQMNLHVTVELIMGEFGEWTHQFDYVLRTHRMMGPVDLTPVQKRT